METLLKHITMESSYRIRNGIKLRCNFVWETKDGRWVRCLDENFIDHGPAHTQTGSEVKVNEEWTVPHFWEYPNIMMRAKDVDHEAD